MRRAFALLCCAALVAGGVSARQKPTPAPEDVPTAVAGDLGLAGAACPDIARFLNARSAAAPSLSPDGRLVAFRTSTTGTPQLWVAETKPGAAPRQITFGESVTFHEWSPAGDWIAYGVDRSGNEREGFYLISPDGTSEVELLAPSEAFRSWGGFSRDGRLAAFAATEPGGNDFHIYTLNLKAEELRPLRVYAGQGGTYVASWRPDGSGLLLSKTRGEDANDVLYLDLAAGEAKTLFQPKEAARYGSFAWTPDGRGFYLATDEGRDFGGLAFYDFAARKLNWVETPARDVERVALSADGRWLVWSENVEGFSELSARDLRTKRTTALAPTATRGEGAKTTTEAVRGVVGALDWAARADVLAFQLSAPGVPGDIWVFEPSKASNVTAGAPRGALPGGPRMLNSGGPLMLGGVSRVTESTLAGLDPARFVAPEAVSFKGHDGETLHALLYLPRGASPQTRAPVVLNVHGGPTSQARPSFGSVTQYLVARGYAVLDLNFRGSTGYGKRYARLDNGRLRPNAVKDMGAAVEWLAKSERPVNASKVAVMGGSYGGYMTYAALALLPDKFAAGVSFVGVSNWVTALEGASPELKASDRLEYGNIDDAADREFFKQLSPITHVANVKAPILVSHGANDPRDPVTESDQFVRAIRERGGEVEYLRWPDEGHSIRKLSNRVTAYRRVARFLERTLGRGAAACGGQ
ncbi:MAG TPA: S9 family peptidase [Pyrinomonadaceae bacterium]|jgi:dipeptidyl aminopeptidase/acylaminoacyl peptidase